MASTSSGHQIDLGQLSESELYAIISRYVMPSELLDVYDYPKRDPHAPELRRVPVKFGGSRRNLREMFASVYECYRCKTRYQVESTGFPVPAAGACTYHPNKYMERGSKWGCCGGERESVGCATNPYHVQDGCLELQNYLGYEETQNKPERDPHNHGIFAVDCEMCYTTYGLELARVTVVNHKGEAVYERLIKPTNPILDYNTRFTGITKSDMDKVTTKLKDVQEDLLSMFSSKSILIGHGLDHDLQCLKLFHEHVIDTAQLFPHRKGFPFKIGLKALAQERLRMTIQDKASHDSKEDAVAALKLVLFRARKDSPSKFK